MQVFHMSLSCGKKGDNACLVHANPITHHEHCFPFFFSIFFSPHSVCLDSLAIIVLHCPCHLPTSAWNYATCGAQIGELTSNLARWRYQLWFWDCLWNLAPWCRFSSLGLTRAIRKFITQYLSYSLHYEWQRLHCHQRAFPWAHSSTSNLAWRWRPFLGRLKAGKEDAAMYHRALQVP